MIDKLITLLQLLEHSFPAHKPCIHMALYGSDKAGWQPRLAISVFREHRGFTLGDGVTEEVLFLDPGDLEKAPQDLTDEIVYLVEHRIACVTAE